VLLVSTAAILAACPLAHAQEDYTVLKAFTLSDLGPATELVKATDGNFYGGTPVAVYRFTPGGAYTVIGSVGPTPYTGGLVQASDGYLYGVCGQFLFRMSLDGAASILHTITEVSGGQFVGPLVEADDGDLYGVTRLNGEFGLGTFFRITREGEYTTLRSVTPEEGYSDATKLLKGKDGYLYGNMGWGGPGTGP
jgi:hypothetical protein